MILDLPVITFIWLCFGAFCFWMGYMTGEWWGRNSWRVEQEEMDMEKEEIK